MHDKPCPSCGYCPTCGRRNQTVTPWYTWPWKPGPYWYSGAGTAGNPVTITWKDNNGGNYGTSGVVV